MEEKSMKDKFCMYCGNRLTKNDYLKGCCDKCGDKLIEDEIGYKKGDTT